MKPTSRRRYLATLGVLGILLLQSCSSASPSPEALDTTSPSPDDTSLSAPSTSPLPISLPSAENIGLDGNTLEAARARIAAGEAPKPSDFSFALMDSAEYKEMVEPRTGPAAIKAQGGFDQTGNPAPRYAGLSSVIGFSRDWVSADESYTLREEVAYLSSESEASTYAKNLKQELSVMKIPEISEKAPNVEYAVEFGIKSLDPARQCVSVAIARRGRLVSLATFSHACTSFSGTWSSLLSSYILDRASKNLGL